jgi:hypothetical protein
MPPIREKNDLEKLLSDPMKGMKRTRGQGGILSRVVRSIWFQNSTSYTWLERNIDDFIYKGTRSLGGKKNKKTASYWGKSNIRSQMAVPSMTWKNFFKNLRVMKIVRMEVCFKFHFHPLTRLPPTIVEVEVSVDGESADFEDDEGDEE